MNVDERSGENYDSSNSPLVASSLSRKEPNALLSAICCLIKDYNSKWRLVSCLLDVGSQTCLTSNECANRLQLKEERINTEPKCPNDAICLNDLSMVITRRDTATIAKKDKNLRKIWLY
ncbi:hypothetical protein CEXT_317731 [Caerostris extrusa]|uniref:Uncharacterized protein n=1 Tax=Caerostris extrusa TaxID=172846 RepID=A0AAV4MWZ3_CAEEX|nr:hypothetical protein CEXT_317731 [Caerostris extrusa]